MMGRYFFEKYPKKLSRPWGKNKIKFPFWNKFFDKKNQPRRSKMKIKRNLDKNNGDESMRQLLIIFKVTAIEIESKLLYIYIKTSARLPKGATNWWKLFTSFWPIRARAI